MCVSVKDCYSRVGVSPLTPEKGAVVLSGQFISVSF